MKFIKRLVHGLTVYEYGGKWPGATELAEDDPNQLTVGPMFLRWSTEEDLGGDPPTTDVTPCYYEVWCVTREVYVSFFGSEASQLLGGNFQVDRERLHEYMRQLMVTVREFPYSRIEFSDSEMPALEAFQEIKIRLREIADQVASDDDELEEEERGVSDEPEVDAGNGQVTA